MKQVENNTEKITTKVPPSILEKLEARAKQNDLNKSQIIRRLITEYLS